MKSSDLQKLYEEISARAQIVAVSKTHPWPEVAWLYEAGCHDFGENKVQEALLKKEQAPRDVRWHLIGTLQKNKVAKAIDNFALIHSVDSLELAQKIASYQKRVPILLQVNLNHRHGFLPDELRRLFPVLKELHPLQIEGLMTLAPDTDDRAAIRTCFRSLRLLRDELQLKELSMGMTNDYPIALDEGATILRLGSLFFGAR